MKRLIILLVTAATLYLSVGYWFFPNSPYPRIVLEKLTYPVYRVFGVVNYGTVEVKNFFTNWQLWLVSKKKLVKQIKNLETIEEELQQNKIKIITLQQQLDGLKNFTNFSCPDLFLNVTVPVYGSAKNFYESVLVAGAPAQIDILKDNPVLADKGLVGRVMESSKRILKILLITDTESKVPVKILTSQENAIAVGNGSNLLILEHLQSQENYIDNYKVLPKQGDVVVTSGIGGVYPPNIPVGIILKADDDSTLVKPFVEFSKLNFVAILYEKSAL